MSLRAVWSILRLIDWFAPVLGGLHQVGAAAVEQGQQRLEDGRRSGGEAGAAGDPGTGPGDAAAGASYDELRREPVPGVGALLVVTVGAAGRDGAEVQRGGSSPPDVADGGQDRRQQLRLPRALPRVVREAGHDQRLPEGERRRD